MCKDSNFRLISVKKKKKQNKKGINACKENLIHWISVYYLT